MRNGEARLKGGVNGEARFEGQKREAERRGSKDRSLLRWPKLMKDQKGGRKVILLWSRPSGDPDVIPGEVGWQSYSELAEAEASV